MKFDVVRPRDLGPAELAHWRDLQRRNDPRPNPFLSPEYSVAVGEVRDDAYVAVISDGAHITAFFPFERSQWPGIGRPIGAGLSDLQGMIYEPGLGLDVRALLRGCNLKVWEFDHLNPEQPIFRNHHKALHPSPVIDLSGGYDAYANDLAARSTKIYKSTLKKERRLGREVGDLWFDFDSRDTEALHTLLVWKSAQYRRTGRQDRFARPWIVRLIERLHQVNTACFVGTLGLLYAGDKLIAGNFGLRTETTMVAWFPAYDPAYARYSPGLIHRLQLCRASAAAGVTLMDLGRGGKAYKDSLKNGELWVAEGRIASASPSAAGHWLTYEPRRRLRNLVLDTPMLYRSADRVAKWLGRHSSEGSAPVATGK